MTDNALTRSILGCLLGAAAGDALGLPMEGLSAARRRRMFPEIVPYQLFLGRGMVSDDAEHLCLVAQALISSGGDPDRFAKDLAWRLRWWIAALPAGIGLATLRALIKLWLFFPAHKSGVFSAGNGPAMRAAIIGVVHTDDPARRRALCRLSTRLTHTDPKAEHGAQAVALAAAMSSRDRADSGVFLAALEQELGPDAGEFLALASKAAESASRGEETARFAESLGLGRGVTGYMHHTAPAVLHAWFRHPHDLPAALEEIIRCGGDTDTTASILGGIVGANVGPEGVPREMRDRLWSWPYSVSWIETLGRALAAAAASGRPAQAPGIFFPFALARNLFFMGVVLAHGFRRLLPPY